MRSRKGHDILRFLWMNGVRLHGKTLKKHGIIEPDHDRPGWFFVSEDRDLICEARALDAKMKLRGCRCGNIGFPCPVHE